MENRRAKDFPLSTDEEILSRDINELTFERWKSDCKFLQCIELIISQTPLQWNHPSRIRRAVLNAKLNSSELCFSVDFANSVQQGNDVVIQQPFPVGLSASKYSVRLSMILNICFYFIAEDSLLSGGVKNKVAKKVDGLFSGSKK